ncbi:glycoside hydrolase [Terrimonas alba]|uniref:glycoside hydrolase n=1 Tax=Terrimonas alba TaxID=3349636 RepID=UPI0035F39E09
MTITFNIKRIILFVAILVAVDAQSQESNASVIMFDPSKTYQAIDNFAASDAWSCQFVGNWPEEKKNAIADLLFSTDTLKDGAPKGIGLSMWRYNIGAGSANQGIKSGIKDEWRRAAFLENDSNEATARIKAQNWFLLAAQKRGVNQFLAFFNSPPVHLTINKKAFASKGHTNIDGNRYKDFATYAVEAISQVKKATGVSFNYISPVNEPQWDWSDGKQEGCPYNNAEIGKLVNVFNGEFLRSNLTTKIIVPESGHLKYLLKSDDKPGKDNQVNAFFNSSSADYVGNLPAIKGVTAAHSYFSTSPYRDAVALRTQIRDSIFKIKGLELWQTEYCILGDNAGEIDGDKKDLGIDPALYVAKVIYEDLVWANASAWQWWLAISPYNYKDGLIYIDKNKTNGNYYDSKILWVLGNYSFFVRPGMNRIEASTTAKELFVSAFKDSKDRYVIIIVNPSAEKKPISFKKENVALSADKMLVTYTTDATNNLKKSSVPINKLIIPAKSVVSVILD